MGRAPAAGLIRCIPVVLLTTVSACGSRAGTATVEPTGTRAKIENRASVDMDIYLTRQDGQAARLGFAPGDQTTSFALPTGLTAGATAIRFEARPVHGRGSAVLSEPFQIRAGQELTWSIPPQ